MYRIKAACTATVVFREKELKVKWKICEIFDDMWIV